MNYIPSHHKTLSTLSQISEHGTNVKNSYNNAYKKDCNNNLTLSINNNTIDKTKELTASSSSSLLTGQTTLKKDIYNSNHKYLPTFQNTNHSKGGTINLYNTKGNNTSLNIITKQTINPINEVPKTMLTSAKTSTNLRISSYICKSNINNSNTNIKKNIITSYKSNTLSNSYSVSNYSLKTSNKLKSYNDNSNNHTNKTGYTIQFPQKRK